MLKYKYSKRPHFWEEKGNMIKRKEKFIRKGKYQESKGTIQALKVKLKNYKLCKERKC